MGEKNACGKRAKPKERERKIRSLKGARPWNKEWERSKKGRKTSTGLTSPPLCS